MFEGQCETASPPGNTLYSVRKELPHKELQSILVESVLATNLHSVRFSIGGQEMFEWKRDELEDLKGKNLLEMFLVEQPKTIPLQHCLYHKVYLEFMYDLSGLNKPLEEEVWEPFPHKFGDNVVVNLASLRQWDDGEIEICKARSVIKPICVVPLTVVSLQEGTQSVETKYSIPVWNRILDIHFDEPRRVHLEKECSLRQDEKGVFWAKNQLRISHGMAQLTYRL